MDLIEAIKTSPEREHVSGLFGVGTSNKEENFYLLYTVMDSISNEDNPAAKKILTEQLEHALVVSEDLNNYLSKAKEIEQEVMDHLPAEAKKENTWETDEPSFFSLVAASQFKQLAITHPTDQIQSANVVLDANGQQYLKQDQVYDGYCGDKAVSQVTNTPHDPRATRARLGEILIEQPVFQPIVEEKSPAGVQLQQKVSNYKPEERFKALKKLIPKFEICKQYMLNHIQTYLSSVELSDQAKGNFQSKKDMLESCQSYSELWKCSLYRTKMLHP